MKKFFDPSQPLGCAHVEKECIGVVTAYNFAGGKHSGKEVAAKVFLAKIRRKIINNNGLKEVGTGISEISEAVVARFVVDAANAGLVSELDDVTVVLVAARMDNKGGGGAACSVKVREPGEV